MINLLVSVIVPVYNVAPYLNECIQSIVSQTYKELEILLIDDGSTDGSGELCDNWEARDNRIKVFHKENGGVSSARNRGLLECTGDAIGFVDADDWLEPKMYEKLAKGLHGADAVSCGYIDYPFGIDKPIQKGIKPLESCDFAQAVVYIYERNGYFTSLCNKLFSRQIIYTAGKPLLLDEDIAVGEDEVWLFQALRELKSMAFVPEALYHWRPRSGSATRNEIVSDKKMSVFRAKKRALEIIPQTEKVQTLARSVVYNDCYGLKVLAYCTGNKKAYKRIVSELKPMRKYWLKCKDTPLMRKMKVGVMETEMLFRLPKKLVAYTNTLTGKH